MKDSIIGLKSFILFSLFIQGQSYLFQIPIIHNPITFQQGVINKNYATSFQKKETNDYIYKSRNFQLKHTSATSLMIDEIPPEEIHKEKIGKFKSKLTKMGMIAYISSMCLALPFALLPGEILYRTKLINQVKREHISLRAGQFTARWLLRLIPFAKVKVTPLSKDEKQEGFEPSVWVCNHISMLDVFFLLALDKKLRGKNKRPIKVVYWQELDNNPITRILFRSCGFIPIQMTANKPGEANEYDKAGFKKFLKQVKVAFDNGFDIGILPEGQLNPSPESGLLPVFQGAYTLSRMSKRPIRMMALCGTHNIWFSDDPIGSSEIRGREVMLRAYPNKFWFNNGEEFSKTFSKIVGYFGATGKDLPQEELDPLLDGSFWEKENQKKEAKS